MMSLYSGGSCREAAHSGAVCVCVPHTGGLALHLVTTSCRSKCSWWGPHVLGSILWVDAGLRVFRRRAGVSAALLSQSMGEQAVGTKNLGSCSLLLHVQDGDSSATWCQSPGSPQLCFPRGARPQHGFVWLSLPLPGPMGTHHYVHCCSQGLQRTITHRTQNL